MVTHAWNLTFDKLLLVQMVRKAHAHLLQAMDTEEQGRRPGRWNREDGMKVADLLGEKSLMKTSTFEGRVQVEVNTEVYNNRIYCCHSQTTGPSELFVEHFQTFCLRRNWQ